MSNPKNELWPNGPELPTSVPTTEGPLARLMRGLGIDDKVAPIAALKRIDETPVAVSIPVSLSTADECICPTCRIFEIEPETTMCPRCNRKAGIRAVKLDERRRHLESVTREVLALKLDAIDPDWHQRFLTTDAAARFYRKELAK